MKKMIAMLALSAFTLGTFAQTVPAQDSTKTSKKEKKDSKSDTTKKDTLRKG